MRAVAHAALALDADAIDDGRLVRVDGAHGTLAGAEAAGYAFFQVCLGLGFEELGRLAVDAPADLVLFDPQTVRDVASFSDPKQPAEGIEAVMVNGVMSYGSDKKIIGRAGRFLRRQMN